MQGLAATGSSASRVLVAHRRRMHRASSGAGHRPHPHASAADARPRARSHPAAPLVPYVYASGTFHYVGDPVVVRHPAVVLPAFRLPGAARDSATSVDLGL